MADDYATRSWRSMPFSNGVETPKNRVGHNATALACKHCGSVSIVGADRLRVSLRQGSFFCDMECANAIKKWQYRTKDHQDRTGITQAKEAKEANRLLRIKASVVCCLCCGIAFHRSTTSAFCVDCIGAVSKLRARLSRKKHYIPKERTVQITCDHCGRTCLCYRKARFCSLRCSSRHSNRNREHCKRSKSFGSNVSFSKLMKKHKSRCVKCGIRCTVPNGTYNPAEATIDHILPLSKGGLHIPSNVQLLCRRCNCSVKNDKVEPGVQLLLGLRG